MINTNDNDNKSNNNTNNINNTCIYINMDGIVIFLGGAIWAP